MNQNKRNYYLMSTLKLKESTSTLEIFPGTSTFKIFEWTLRLRNTFKYATSDFAAISKSSSITKARLSVAFSKALGLRNGGEVLSLAFELLLPTIRDVDACSE